MPIHDWTRVEPGIFHAFHHDWITELARSLNRGLLPDDYYALPEQQAAGFGPDVLAVRHVSGDHIVAMLEIVSPGNKASRHAFRSLMDKACELLERRIHLLILDPFPPEEPFVLPEDKRLTRTLVAYECDLTTRAYIELIAVGDILPSMPLFLRPNAHVLVPLEATYQASFSAIPRRWRSILEAPTSPAERP